MLMLMFHALGSDSWLHEKRRVTLLTSILHLKCSLYRMLHLLHHPNPSSHPFLAI